MLLEEGGLLLLKLHICPLPSNPGILGCLVLLKPGCQDKGAELGFSLLGLWPPECTRGPHPDTAASAEAWLCCPAPAGLLPGTALHSARHSAGSWTQSPFCPLGQAVPPGHSSKPARRSFRAVLLSCCLEGCWATVRPWREGSLGWPWGLRAQRPGQFSPEGGAGGVLLLPLSCLCVGRPVAWLSRLPPPADQKQAFAPPLSSACICGVSVFSGIVFCVPRLSEVYTAKAHCRMFLFPPHSEFVEDTHRPLSRSASVFSVAELPLSVSVAHD